MKRYLLILLLMIATMCSAQSSTLIGTLQTPGGQPFTGTLWLTLSQPGVTLPACSGTPTYVVPAVPIAVIVNAGNLVGTNAVWGSDCMNPTGIPYNVVMKDASNNTLLTDQWLIIGSTFNVGTAVSTLSNTVTYVPETGPIGPQGTPGPNCSVSSPPGTCDLGTNTLKAGNVVAGAKVVIPQSLLPSAASLNVVCLGDSICEYGTGSTYLSMLEGMSVLSGRVASTTLCSYSGQTIAYIASQYSACVHPVSPAVTGVPGVLLIEGGTNDMNESVPLATMKSGMSGILAAATADGWTIGLSNNYAISFWSYRAVDYLVREPWNSWLSTQYQAGAFKYYFDWDNLIRDPFDPNVLDGGVHPTVSTRYLIAQQMNNVLAGNGTAPTVSTLPPTTLMNIPFWDVTEEETSYGSANDYWVNVGEWNVAAPSTGVYTRSLTLNIAGEGGSYSYGVLYGQITSNVCANASCVQGTFYGFQNTNNSSHSPDIETIKFVQHPGGTLGFDWDVYVQIQGVYGYIRADALTSSYGATWTPVMLPNVTGPGVDSSTVKSATIAAVVNTSSSFAMTGSNTAGAYQVKINNNDGTNAGVINGSGVGGTTIYYSAPNQQFYSGATQELLLNGSAFLYVPLNFSSYGSISADAGNGGEVNINGAGRLYLNQGGVNYALLSGSTWFQYQRITSTASAQFTTALLTAAAPTAAAGQIGYGGTTVANTFCGTLVGSAGCIVVNVAGTTRYIPYY